MDGKVDYSQWSSEKLLERVTSLEEDLRRQNARYELLAQKRRTPSPLPQPKRSRSIRQIDPSKYSTRLIALKFAYLGQRYNGLEYHANNNTRYPTIEEEMWKALDKAKLIFPTPNPALKEGEPNWEGCEYSKSGRTDKGVSAFGQVIGIRVRSNKPLEKQDKEAGAINGKEVFEQDGSNPKSEDETSPLNQAAFDPIKDEIPYPQILNRLLPPEIRVLAWCPSPPPDFSARFSCGERCYKYFFTQPAFTPTVGQEDLLPVSRGDDGQQREGWLDIESMRAAAENFEGSHDFRNFCKVDPSKQIDNFRRVINRSEIVEVNSRDQRRRMGFLDLPPFQQRYPPPPLPSAEDTPNTNSHAHESMTPISQQTPKIYAFKVRGSGFLWHQVRHMVAILFLVGQGLEQPSLITDLLNTAKHPEKPTYDMADPSPLVLEACNFPGAGLDWIHLGEYTGHEAGVRKAGAKGNGKHGLSGTVDELWRVWHRHKIDETLAGSLLDIAAGDRDGAGVGDDGIEERPSGNSVRNTESQKVYQGGDAPRLVGKYIPILQRPRMETVDAINAKYLKRKGLDPPDRNRLKSE
ncbi:pseudouridine synthase deg1 [Xanthoria calcicola]